MKFMLEAMKKVGWYVDIITDWSVATSQYHEMMASSYNVISAYTYIGYSIMFGNLCPQLTNQMLRFLMS